MAKTKMSNRWEAAAALGISHATLRRWENVKLTPILTELGEHVFLAEEVSALAEAIRTGAATGLLSRTVTPAQKSARIRRETERRERLETLEAKRLGVSVKVLRARKLRALEERGTLLPGARLMTTKLLAAIRDGIQAGERDVDITRRLALRHGIVWSVRHDKAWRGR